MPPCIWPPGVRFPSRGTYCSRLLLKVLPHSQPVAVWGLQVSRRQLPPEEGPPDSYVYDPRGPVPTSGGCNMGAPPGINATFAVLCGPQDQGPPRPDPPLLTARCLHCRYPQSAVGPPANQVDAAVSLTHPFLFKQRQWDNGRRGGPASGEPRPPRHFGVHVRPAAPLAASHWCASAYGPLEDSFLLGTVWAQKCRDGNSVAREQ